MGQSFDVIVLGAGAAGLMCAIEAAKRGRSVAVLEHAEQIGKKILISGGGRCNFTNLDCRPEDFLSANPHFCKSAMARYTPADFIALVEEHGITYHEKTLGQLFCDNSARQITNLLERECRAAGVRICLRTRVSDVTKARGFALRSGEDEFWAQALVVATGGLSLPKVGATSFGYDLARQFGLAIREPRPALVPFVFDAADLKRYGDLAGVSTEVIASCGKQSFREKMLITHRGLSGPAILQISSYWKKPQRVSIDLAPGQDLTAALRSQGAPRSLEAAKSAFRAIMPQRLADRWLDLHAPAKWTNAGLEDLERRAHQWEIAPAGTEGFEKAEVTVGGISTDELSAQTMECRKVPGLFFIGEVVDVTGHLGGFNFQWAWASGFCAGQAV
jgi:predicted Rossmann fold flavoprotein